MTEAKYTKEDLDKLPTDQREALARRQAEFTGESNVLEHEARSLVVEGNDTSGYIGVDPEYRNYANETEAPLLSDDEVELYEATAEAEEKAASDAEAAKEEASKDAETTPAPTPAPKPKAAPAPAKE